MRKPRVFRIVTDATSEGLTRMDRKAFDDFWNRAVQRAKEDHDTAPQREWSEREIEAGRTLERAMRSTGGGRHSGR